MSARDMPRLLPCCVVTMRRLPFHRRENPFFHRGVVVEDELLPRIRTRIAVFGGLEQGAGQRAGQVRRAQRLGVGLPLAEARLAVHQTGRASSRARVWQYVSTTVDPVSIKKTQKPNHAQ